MVKKYRYNRYPITSQQSAGQKKTITKTWEKERWI
jgi:hypothetical protein